MWMSRHDLHITCMRQMCFGPKGLLLTVLFITNHCLGCLAKLDTHDTYGTEGADGSKRTGR